MYCMVYFIQVFQGNEPLADTKMLSINVSIELAQLFEEKIALGIYQNEEMVIRDALRALDERNVEVDPWRGDTHSRLQII